jgi:hypothetical protein
MIERNISPPRNSLSKLETHNNPSKLVRYLKGINKGKLIDTPFYAVGSASVENNNNSSSLTQYQMELNYFENLREDSQICMISQNFEIYKEKLRKNFMLPEYDEKQNWFFKTFSQPEQVHIRSKQHNYMTEVKANIYFFSWVERTYKKINTINRTTQFV